MRAALCSFPVSQRFLIFVIFFKKYPYLFRACVFSLSFFYGIGDGGMGNVRTGGKRQRGRGRRTRKKSKLSIVVGVLVFLLRLIALVLGSTREKLDTIPFCC